MTETQIKIAYIAGPFRGESAWDIEQNIREAEGWALYVWRRGIAALCPHANCRFFQGAASDKLFLAGTLEMLSRCDLMLLTGDWEKSSGSVAEKTEAEKLGIPVFDMTDNASAMRFEEYAKLNMHQERAIR